MSFWTDAEVIEMTPEEKYFYLYLLTNPYTTQSGIYEISRKIMAFETGYHLETIDKLLAKFEEKGKIKFDPETNEIFLKNWLKYNWSNSPKVITAVIESLKKVKSTDILLVFWNNIADETKDILIQYGYSIDTLSIEYTKTIDTASINKRKEKEKEKENKKEKDIVTTPNGVVVDTNVPTTNTTQDKTPYQKIVDLYHKLCPSLPRVKVLTNTRRRYIRSRWKEHPDLAFWESFFNRVEQSDFLTGRADYGNRKPFIADLEWLVRPNNFAKVLEGRYDNRKQNNNLDEALDEVAKSWARKWG